MTTSIQTTTRPWPGCQIHPTPAASGPLLAQLLGRRCWPNATRWQPTALPGQSVSLEN